RSGGPRGRCAGVRVRSWAAPGGAYRGARGRPGDTRGPRRLGGTLNPPGTAARSTTGRRGVRSRSAVGGAGAVRAESSGSSVRPPVRGGRARGVSDRPDERGF